MTVETPHPSDTAAHDALADSPPPRGITRRGAIGLCIAAAAAGAGAYAILPRLIGGSPRTYAWSDVAPPLLPMAPDQLPAIGEQCEAALTEHDRPLASTPTLAGFAWTKEGVTAPRSPEAVHKAFEDQIAAEFGQGRVVIVDHWVLSETQAALCALAARAGAGES